jgi:hypothetical protein
MKNMGWTLRTRRAVDRTNGGERLKKNAKSVKTEN